MSVLEFVIVNCFAKLQRRKRNLMLQNRNDEENFRFHFLVSPIAKSLITYIYTIIVAVT